MVFALLLVFAALINSDLAQKDVTIILPDRNSDCEKWKGHPFVDQDAIGTWFLLHFKMDNDTGEGITSCVRVTLVDDEIRNDVKSRFNHYLASLDWSKLVFRLQIPCGVPPGRRMNEHFLEKLDTDGYFRTLTLPNQGTALDYASFGRFPMRMRMVHGKYLGMMDCYNRFVFLLGKRRSKAAELDYVLQRYINSKKWPSPDDYKNTA